MLQDIKDLQQEAVTKLVNVLSDTPKKEVTFKAPTGSGKTYMMADFMNRMLAEDQNCLFIVSTLSKSNLAEQNFDKFKDYAEKGTFPSLNPFLIKSENSGEGSLYIPTAYNVYVLPRDLYKDKSKLKKEGTFLNFLSTMRGDLFENQHSKKIYLIKDECHIATSNLDDLKEKGFFDQVINFSATPKLLRKQNPDVEITNTEAQNVKLIKKIERGNESDSLEVALKKFEEVKAAYANDLEVYPCLIIQISNKEKAEEELKKEIYPALEKHNLKWVYITGEDKTCDTNDDGLRKLPVSKWKDYMKSKTSSIAVIIFKMVISEGWDIPRACMLYQIRDSQSKQLDEQVMGRVRRNPRLLDFETLSEEAKKLACTAWIWGIIPPEESRAKHVHLVKNVQYTIREEIRVTPTKLKDINASKSFDVDKYIENLERKERSISPPSIFEMYKNLMRQNNDIQEMCYQYADSFDKWRIFAENLSEIKVSYDAAMENYEKNMVVDPPVSFPLESYYDESEQTLTLEDWVWCRENANDFSFDSEAEKKWAELLKDIRRDSIGEITQENKSKFLWGKNYPFNSEIKYEYYSNGIHCSYPDFIMKDKSGKIHIFEVKSVNKSSTKNIDNKEYENKIRALEKCYQASSKKTDHIFYLPILDGSKWKIQKYENGDKETIDENQFKNSLRNL